MQSIQTILRHGRGGEPLAPLAALRPDLVLAFGSPRMIENAAPDLAAWFPDACRVGCSTAGDVSSSGIVDGACVVTAVRFDAVRPGQASTRIACRADSSAAGARLAKALPAQGLRAILLLGPGRGADGSAVLDALRENLGVSVPIVGGLAGKAAADTRTLVLDGAGCDERTIVAVGFYGASLVFGHGSGSGWSPFGPERRITRAEGNRLHTLDDEPALDVYKRYLGDYAKDLPASGLLFPLRVTGGDPQAVGRIRGILGIDEATGSLRLAGNIGSGASVRMLHSSTDRLVDGAEAASLSARAMLRPQDADNGLLLLVSCSGRREVMGERCEEEIDAAFAAFPKAGAMAGFYSFGEIGPEDGDGRPGFFNQTMTVAFINER